LRLAVISPFVDRRHGTERCLAEQLERFASQSGAEIHLYSQRVEDLAGVVRYPADSCGKIVWHKVSRLPGPHLLGYLWWFIANHVQRYCDAKFRGLTFDLTYSAGINAVNADAISIHVIFAEFYNRVHPRLRLRNVPRTRWPIILHRRLYYQLICWLERHIYPRKCVALTAISQHTANCARELFGRDDALVVRYGVDGAVFCPEGRLQRRQSSREALQIAPNDFCLLLIGNDWKNKGLDTLLNAVATCREVPVCLLVVGVDDTRGYTDLVQGLRLKSKVQFLQPSADVMQFYAAADTYVAPSLEDAYGLPILEAMACGLPVIASTRAGASEIVRDGENGLLLRNPEDSCELAVLLQTMYMDVVFREKLGSEATRTAQGQTWDRNADATWKFLKAAHEGKTRSAGI
jgi:glycosyltransferase involved in cell wall biosynthesis